MNLTGATVNFVMRSMDNAVPSINAAATIVNAAAGTVSFTPTALQTAIAGDFIGSWVVTSGGTAQTFPTVGYLEIVIEPSLTGVTGLPQTIVDLEEVKEHLNIPATDRQHDVKLLRFLYGLVPVIEDITGPVLPKVYNEWYDGGQYHISFRHRPVCQLMAASFYIGPIEYQAAIVGNPAAGSIYSVMMDPDASVGGRRLVRRGPGGGMIPFPNSLQSVHVIYQAGRSPVPYNITLAALELIKLNYQPSQQGNLREFGGGMDTDDEMTPAIPMGFFVPGRVREMLSGSRRHPSIA